MSSTTTLTQRITDHPTTPIHRNLEPTSRNQTRPKRQASVDSSPRSLTFNASRLPQLEFCGQPTRYNPQLRELGFQPQLRSNSNPKFQPFNLGASRGFHGYSCVCLQKSMNRKEGLCGLRHNSWAFVPLRGRLGRVYGLSFVLCWAGFKNKVKGEDNGLKWQVIGSLCPLGQPAYGQNDWA
ncbi:hypothetical protein Droror1_Dr00006325 [Drosera rotundifolia]